MARYIDADELLQLVPDDLPYKASVKRVLTLAPIADVVPREEVDRLRSILDSYALQYGTVKSQQKVNDRVKRETAMEIFKELETVLYSAVGKKMLYVLNIRFDDYNAIKKKYTEDEEEKDCLCPRCREKKNDE